MDEVTEALQEQIAKMDALYLVAMRLTADNDHSRALGCTDWQAAWCPIHGDCTCDKTFGHTIQLPDGSQKPVKCPLHGEEHYGRNVLVTHTARCPYHRWVDTPLGESGRHYICETCGAQASVDRKS